MDADPDGPTDTGVADAVLIRDVVAGSESAFVALYDRHASAIFTRALQLARDRSVAEEVVQETFLVLWNRAELFDPAQGSLAGWLHTIARNRSVDRVRAAGRRVPAAPFSSLLGEGSDDASSVDWLLESSDPVGGARAAPGPEAALLLTESRVAVREALAILDETELQTILLAYRDGLSQSEIAVRLGWPLGTVKTRTRRALRRLRETLERPPADGRAATGQAIAPGEEDRPTGTG